MHPPNAQNATANFIRSALEGLASHLVEDRLHLKAIDIPPAVGGRGWGAPNSIYLVFPTKGNMEPETRNGFPGVTPLPQKQLTVTAMLFRVALV